MLIVYYSPLTVACWLRRVPSAGLPDQTAGIAEAVSLGAKEYLDFSLDYLREAGYAELPELNFQIGRQAPLEQTPSNGTQTQRKTQSFSKAGLDYLIFSESIYFRVDCVVLVWPKILT